MSDPGQIPWGKLSDAAFLILRAMLHICSDVFDLQCGMIPIPSIPSWMRSRESVTVSMLLAGEEDDGEGRDQEAGEEAAAEAQGEDQEAPPQGPLE